MDSKSTQKHFVTNNNSNNNNNKISSYLFQIKQTKTPNVPQDCTAFLMCVLNTWT